MAFATALGLGFASLPFTRLVDHALVAGAAVLVTVLILAVALVPWERLPRSLAALPPAAVVLLVFLLREGTGGLRDPVDYEALLLLPVLRLALYARDPGMRLRDIADCVGVTERTAFGAVCDLAEDGYLRRYKEGNRNRYEVNPEAPFRHPRWTTTGSASCWRYLCRGSSRDPRRRGSAGLRKDNAAAA